MLIDKRILINFLLLQTWKIGYELHKDQRFIRFRRNELKIKLLQNENPFFVFYPNHPSSKDELKWIDMSYDQSLEKKNVMPQTLDHMNGV